MMVLNDLKPPVTIEQCMEYRDEMLRMVWVISPWMSHEELEDFLHDFYIHEQRRGRIEKWDGRCSLGSWLMTTMRWYRSNINKSWQDDRPLYDQSRPWSSWCDSTSVSYDIPIQLREYQMMYPQHRETLEHLLSDKNLIELDKWRSRAFGMVKEMRHDLQASGRLLETGEYELTVGRGVVSDMLARWG